MPWAIAPREQTEVPMVMWLSDGFTRTAALDRDCLRQRALAPASHDHLFHSVLGLLDVRTAIHDATLDVSAACRASS
jgi:lipid A ethanolaminephosphotransferase